MGVTVERAVLAFGFGFAEILADAHDQGVVFIEELDVLGQVGLEEVLEFVIVKGGIDQTVACGHSGGVGVDHKDGTVQGIEEDGVCGFRADAVDGYEVFSQVIGVVTGEVFQLPVTVLHEPGQEVFQAFCLDPIISGRTDQCFEFFLAQAVKRPGLQCIGTLDIIDCLFHI